ncbi:uncharacterized protein LOC133796292 [Humulus lupulus]|uniref:uncharacterized protein LOC133796292 n=1 Tax=Humulus lupulus TaxID=3486 RepID=UPI002B41312E|nr:uncharacterized protein LOC133796292 [Humulus lupulus]
MNEIKSVNEGAFNWLSKKRREEWTKSHFRERVKCDMVLNNLCESFNSAILMARDKPIITLLEKLRFWLMCRFYTKRETISKMVHPVGKRILQIIEKNKKVARNCFPRRFDKTKFEVTFLSNETFVVDLVTKACTCRGFQLTGTPCGHALACIWFSNVQLMDFVDDFYKRAALEVTYAGVIEPMPSPDKRPNIGLNLVIPPEPTNMSGRPKKSRNREHLPCKKLGPPPKKNPKQETVKRKERSQRQKARADAQMQ